MIKIINTICRYTVAIVFIFSGFVKLVDPYGLAYKISDYLEVFHLNLPLGLGVLLSVIMSVTEFVIGVNLFFKTNYRKILKLTLALMIYFFIVTLYIAIANPVTDCGCFGDALVISNWATFIKNAVLLLMTIELLRNKNYMRSRVVELNQKLLFGVSLIFAMFIAINALRHLPFVDFRPYNVGVDIRKAMTLQDGEAHDEYKTTYYYEKDGKTESFTEDNYPWQDTTWHYVDSESVLVKEGAKPAIYDFVLSHTTMGDITEEVLDDQGYTFLLVAPKLSQASLKHLEDVYSTYEYALANGHRFLLLTSSLTSEIEVFRGQLGVPVEACHVDEIQLKTMVRSHPGLILLKEGHIIAKYHHNDIPDFAESSSPLTMILSQHESQKSRIIILLLTLVLGGVYYHLTKTKDYTK